MYGDRFKAVDPTRLFIDATTTAGWREKGFFSVTNDGNSSLMMQVLNQKQSYPTPKGDYDAEEDQKCPKNSSELEKYFNKKPHNGMPFGFPNLKKEEFEKLSSWILKGAKAEDKVSSYNKAEIKKWEEFFNNEKTKYRVTARYIYEHLFLAHIKFNTIDNIYFELVRSKTKDGEIEVIPTVFPYDNPNGEFYYRFREIKSTIVYKTHMVYNFSDKKLQRYKDLFINTKWLETPKLVPYKNKISTNPFIAYKQIPAKSRYQFLLDDIRYAIMTFIRGPVCKGQVALDVIEDHFWVMFLDPDSDLSIIDNEYYNSIVDDLRMPIELGSNPNLIKSFLDTDYDDLAIKYYKKRVKKYSEYYSNGLDLNTIWKSDDNKSSMLTIYRHFDSASVQYTPLGNLPKTLWVIDYPLLERIYYTLVAGFDIFGNSSHQALARLYMDKLRLDGEQNFLHYLPKKVRKSEFDSWYKGILARIKESYIPTNIKSAIDFSSIHYKNEMALRVIKKSGLKVDKLNFINRSQETIIDELNSKKEIEKALNQLTNRELKFLEDFTSTNANLAYLKIELNSGENLVYSFIVNRWHDNVAFMFAESLRLNSKKDRLNIIEGFIGSYPNMFLVVKENDLKEFFSLIGDYNKDRLSELNKFAVNRADENFWEVYDWFQQEFQKTDSKEWGLFDLNRYYNKSLN